MSETSFHQELRTLADRYAHAVYALTRGFPKAEIYALTSQLQRSALSVVLNYTEGYTRQSDRDYRRFLEIAFGSLKESQYLVGFAIKENFVSEPKAAETLTIADRLGAMLWGILKNMSSTESEKSDAPSSAFRVPRA